MIQLQASNFIKLHKTPVSEAGIRSSKHADNEFGDWSYVWSMGASVGQNQKMSARKPVAAKKTVVYIRIKNVIEFSNSFCTQAVHKNSRKWAGL